MKIVSRPGQDDPYLWLEDVEGARALDWVREKNSTAEAKLGNQPVYKKTEHDFREILFAKDRLPIISYRGGHVYNLWQDEKNIRGLWRRTTLSEYKNQSPQWEILLDLDELARRENKNWVWQGESCLAPEYKKCLLHLSPGGTDAAVIREFDIPTKAFVKDGFYIPEAKNQVAWKDENTLFVGTDFGIGTMTKAGYPRQVRLLERGQKLAEARLIFECNEDEMVASGYTQKTIDGTWNFINRQKDFFHSESFLLETDGRLKKIPIPDDAVIELVFARQLIVRIKSDWSPAGQTFKADTLLSLGLDDLSTAPRLVYAPTDRISIESVASAKSALLLQTLDYVRNRILRLQKNDGQWIAEPLPNQGDGNFRLSSVTPFEDTFILESEGYLTPPSIWEAHLSKNKIKTSELKSLPARFDAKDFAVEQFESTSRDGTKIPYSIIHPKKINFDGQTPTLLYGYGGFEISLTPAYLGGIGKVWLEKNRSAYVVANIRGGGEFGPRWHKAALQENRQRAYDDFISVAEDLIQRKITSSNRLAILGGSNGGLLVGAALTQRPELFKAVVCQVPLLDMFRYTKLLAGHSWMAEYGDPDDPKMREIIGRYSPYQNLRAGVKYPTVLFLTSTKDDRVHPGHARKMAARLIELGQPVLFYENIEGGHGAAANIEQRIKFMALTWTFLSNELANGLTVHP